MKAETLIAQVKDLTAPSPSVAKLVNSLNRADADADEVVQIVNQDPVLSAKLLSICNSAGAGAAHPIASIKQAVFFLGYREIYRRVLSIGFGDALDRALPGYAIGDHELWRHSLVTALATQAVLAEARTDCFEPSVAYTAGLVHDIGKLVLNEVLDPATQSRLRARIEQEGRSRLEAERDVLDTDHCEVGAVLLRRWRLPEELVEAVANHHCPVTCPRPQISAVVHLADCVAHEIGSAPGWHSHAVRADEAAAQSLGLGPEKFQLILLSAHESLQVVNELAQAV